MIKTSVSIGGKKQAVTYTGGVFKNGNHQGILYITTAGDVNIKLENDETFGVMSLPAGYNPINPKEILEASTTASGMWIIM